MIASINGAGVKAGRGGAQHRRQGSLGDRPQKDGTPRGDWGPDGHGLSEDGSVGDAPEVQRGC